MKIYEPNIPYKGIIFGEILPGKTIRIRGHPEEGGHDSFAINLNKNFFVEGHHRHTALHINPRFHPYNVLVLNSFIDCEWGDEERYDNPFVEEEDFELEIKFMEEEFLLSVNGDEVGCFHYRLPLSDVRYIHIDGPVHVEEISYHHEDEHHHHSYEIHEDHMHPFYEPDLPFWVPLHGIGHRKEVHISGIPRSDFRVNFQAGHHDVAFQFNPRFDEEIVVRNSKIDHEWGDEERHSHWFPFEYDVPFNMRIVVDHHKFHVRVNGEHFCDFHHRMDKDDVTALEILADDLDLHHVQIF